MIVKVVGCMGDLLANAHTDGPLCETWVAYLSDSDDLAIDRQGGRRWTKRGQSGDDLGDKRGDISSSRHNGGSRRHNGSSRGIRGSRYAKGKGDGSKDDWRTHFRGLMPSECEGWYGSSSTFDGIQIVVVVILIGEMFYIGSKREW